MNYDFIVYIGRFQPLHDGHVQTINFAREQGRQVIVLVGSANAPRTPKNPFTFDERREMLEGQFRDDITIRPLRDVKYNDQKWAKQVQSTVSESLNKATLLESLHGRKGAIIGHSKDETSYYLKMFPQWKLIEVTEYPGHKANVIDATKIRNLYFEGHLEYTSGVVPTRVYQFLMNFASMRGGSTYDSLVNEYNHLIEYKKEWGPGPFNTTDAVVVQSGHILLIRRKNEPGKDTWALPGGFLDIGESLFDCAIRELYEETSIKVQEKILRDKLVKVKVFDSPKRSTRARIITHVHMFELDHSKPLPKVKGGDDAAEAKWVPLAEFEEMEPEVFSDHWHIVNNMIS